MSPSPSKCPLHNISKVSDIDLEACYSLCITFVFIYHVNKLLWPEKIFKSIDFLTQSYHVGSEHLLMYTDWNCNKLCRRKKGFGKTWGSVNENFHSSANNNNNKKRSVVLFHGPSKDVSFNPLAKFCRWWRDTAACILTGTLEESPCLCTCLIPCALATCQHDTAGLWASKWIKSLVRSGSEREASGSAAALDTCAAPVWFILLDWWTCTVSLAIIQQVHLKNFNKKEHWSFFSERYIVARQFISPECITFFGRDIRNRLFAFRLVYLQHG